VIQFAVNPFKP